MASKMLIFAYVVPGPVESFVELIFHRCLLRAPSEICLLRERHMWLAIHKNRLLFSRLLHTRGGAGHAARKATEDNI